MSTDTVLFMCSKHHKTCYALLYKVIETYDTIILEESILYLQGMYSFYPLSAFKFRGQKKCVCATS